MEETKITVDVVRWYLTVICLIFCPTQTLHQYGTKKELGARFTKPLKTTL